MRDIGLVLGGMKRQYGFLPKLQRLGYANADAAGKVASVRSTRNFALIFEDGLPMAGYGVDGVLHQCETPALVHVEPYAHKYCQCNEGPCRKLYMMYSGDDPFFTGTMHVPVISHVVLTEQLREQVYAILTLASGWHAPGMADQLDLLCANLIMGLLMGRGMEPDEGGLHQRLKQLMDYIRSHCVEDIDFVGLSRHFGFSQRTFIRRCEELTGMSPKRFQLQCRMELGKRYLSESELPLVEIADLTGFCDQYAFAKAFRRLEGLWPADYRRQRRS